MGDMMISRGLIWTAITRLKFMHWKLSKEIRGLFRHIKRMNMKEEEFRVPGSGSGQNQGSYMSALRLSKNGIYMTEADSFDEYVNNL